MHAALVFGSRLEVRLVRIAWGAASPGVTPRVPASNQGGSDVETFICIGELGEFGRKTRSKQSNDSSIQFDALAAGAQLTFLQPTLIAKWGSASGEGACAPRKFRDVARAAVRELVALASRLRLDDFLPGD